MQTVLKHSVGGLTTSTTSTASTATSTTNTATSSKQPAAAVWL